MNCTHSGRSELDELVRPIVLQQEISSTTILHYSKGSPMEYPKLQRLNSKSLKPSITKQNILNLKPLLTFTPSSPVMPRHPCEATSPLRSRSPLGGRLRSRTVRTGVLPGVRGSDGMQAF